MTLCARWQYLNTQEPAAFLGPAGVLRFRGAAGGGHRMACYFWPAPAHAPPRGVIVLVHGQGSFLCFEFLSNALVSVMHARRRACYCCEQHAC